jgi:hypothetical protein
MKQITGLIFGTQGNISLRKLIFKLLVWLMLPQYLNGCGNPVLERSTSSFFWLLLHDRLNTRELLRRKNMDLQDYSCVLCTRNIEEDVLHLFLECPFSKWCWRFVSVHWNTSLLPQDMLIKSRRQFGSKKFSEVIMVAGWTIWCHRNAVIFDASSVSLGHWKEAFKDELSLIIHRANSKTKPLLCDWLSKFS